MGRVSDMFSVFPRGLSLELQVFAHHGRPLPRFQVTLCFGEEFPDPQRQRKLITAHVSISHIPGIVSLFFLEDGCPFREVSNESKRQATWENGEGGHGTQ